MNAQALLRDIKAAAEAEIQYRRAIERAFDRAEQLVIEGKPDEAEDVARAAVALRMDARYELQP